MKLHVIPVKMDLGLLLCFASLFCACNAAVSYSKLTCVIPTITEELTPPFSNCPKEASRNFTLNELISSPIDRTPFSSSEDVVFLRGKHVVNSTHPLLFATGVRKLRLRGRGNVVIICEDNFYIHLDRINGGVSIMNLQFENCIGKLGQYRPTIYFSTSSTGRIIIVNIRIINDHESGEGLVVKPESTHLFTVILHDSFLSTRGMGFYSSGFVSVEYRNRIDPKSSVQISNTKFLASCIELLTSSVQYIIKNTTFTGCKCSPVLSFQGKTERENAMLRDVQISESISSSIIEVTKFSVILEGTIIVQNNAGTLILNLRSNLIINGAYVVFSNNQASNNNRHAGTILLASESVVSVKHRSRVVFQDNRGENCGGITLMNSGLVFIGDSTINFINNAGNKGGALSLYRDSIIRFATKEYNTIQDSVTIKLNFVSNSAIYGGAMYIEDRDYIDPFRYNFTGPVFVLFNFEDSVRLHFANNTASFGGDDIYGGWIGVNNYGYGDANILNHDMIVFEENKDTMASDPIRVCKCTNSIPNCTITEEEVELFPGQTVSLDVVAVGYGYGTVKTFVSATLNHQSHGLVFTNNSNQDARISELEKVQIVERRCTLVNFSSSKEETLIVSPFENNNIPNLDSNLLQNSRELALLFKQLSITLSIKDCPLAFHFDNSSYHCSCLSSLSLHNLKCDNQMLKIFRNKQQWVGLTYTHTIPEEHPGIIAHQHCPYDYCRSDEKSLAISMEYEHHQCAFDRSGTMCGACKPHFSQIFGSSKCRKCSNNLLILAIFPGALLAGLALVVFLITLNLTVSVGTINSLIFYANIIRTQHITFFNPSISSSFLNKFIAWLNLDLGIETCFYSGLNAYVKVWLQFLFPFYIWTLVITIIISSHYSTLASRLSGRNAVQVLATLFLLSYTKVIQIAITVFSSTTIVYPDGYVKSVWLYDGNIDFLLGKHTVLFVFTMLLVVFFVFPYTLSLVTIQWLLKVSHYRISLLVQKLKPFLDAYTGPYKITHRYWTGVLLIARVVLLVTFSLIQESYPSVNLLVITIVSFALILWLYFVRWVYVSPFINILEVASLSNLCLTSVVILFELSRNRHSVVPIYISSGIAFVLFVVICIYHIAFKQDHIKKVVTTLTIKAQGKFRNKVTNKEYEAPNLDAANDEVTHTVVELSELLLAKEHN